MPRVIFQVSDAEKALMVEAAHRELVTLSEWLRRAAEVRLGGLAAGEAGSPAPPAAESAEHFRSARPSAPAARPSGFQPDFKKGK